MADNNQLALIIPAYKADYLQATLESIRRQNNRDFCVYIGDDAGDIRISGIVNTFLNDLPIIYRRFEQNLGSHSLVAHWNRCIAMTKNETWLWLFSDDDIMSENCTENFWNCKNANPHAMIFRNDSVKFVDNGKWVKENTGADYMDTVQFLKAKLTYSFESYMVEYIFHRDLLQKTGGFRDFPLGWCSDDLFWVSASLHSPVVRVQGTKVLWRYSDQNISGRFNSRSVSNKKIYACYLFLKVLKSLNLFLSDPELSDIALSWYMSQFNYLKKGLNFFLRIQALTRLFFIFPFHFIRQRNAISKE